MSFVMRIGIDLGGTKIEAAAMDPAGSLSLARRMPTPAVDYDETISAIVQLTAGLEAEIDPGRGVPGMQPKLPEAVESPAGDRRKVQGGRPVAADPVRAKREVPVVVNVRILRALVGGEPGTEQAGRERIHR